MQDFIPSEKFATTVIGWITVVIDKLGLDRTPDVLSAAYMIAIIGTAVVTGLIVQRIVEFVVGHLIGDRFKQVGKELAEHKVLSRSARIIPPIVLLSLVPFAFVHDHRVTRIIVLAATIYSIIVATIAINSIFQLVWYRYNARHNDKNLPLRGVLDITCGAMWVVAVIVIISIIVHKSPLALLTGLGAFAAVLLLIFRNSILGLVAGVQLSENDMLRVGDWISVPGTDINGIVIDVSLVVVKVRNWNNTVSMLPPYSLVSKHFTNWRYMKQGGSRQIEMSALIDISTVRPLSDDELRSLQSALPPLKAFIDVKLQQRAQGKTADVFNKEAGVIGSIDTNLGLLRAYMNIFIDSHPYVYTERMHMTRILQPTSHGFPLQIFCYLTTADWPAYEGIMAGIFEHLAAVAPLFGLSLYQEPTTRSVYSIGAESKSGAPYFGADPVNSVAPDPATNKMEAPQA